MSIDPVSYFMEFVQSVLSNRVFMILAVVYVISKFFGRGGPMEEVPGSLVKEIHSLAEWDEAMNEAKKAGAVVVADFYATWCPPCRTAAPAFAHLSKELCVNPNNCQFWKVDVDKGRDIATKLKIQSMPTFKVFKNGAQVDEMCGWSKTKLLGMLDKHVKK